MDAQETSIFTAIVISCVIIGIIIIYFIFTIIRQHRRNRELYQSRIKAEITTLEKERTRIAGDLHDELGPVLSAVKFKVNSFDIICPEDQEQLDKVNSHIDNMMSRLREISNDLMPNTLASKGLIIAMEESISRLDKTAGLHINFAHTEIPDLKLETAVNLYRILQEIIHNTIKHAKATDLKIELKTQTGLLVILTSDNGTGYNYEQAARENKGLGLRSMLSRAELLGGEMFIDAAPGQGTQTIFEIPL